MYHVRLLTKASKFVHSMTISPTTFLDMEPFENESPGWNFDVFAALLILECN